MSANDVTQQLARLAGIARSWVAANWNTKAAAVSAVATATGIALVCWWKSDMARRFYANRLSWLNLDYDRVMTNRKRQLLSRLESIKDDKEDARLVILEIGCGGGINLKYYPAGSELIFVEPNRHYEAMLYETARQHPELQILAFHVSPAENMREVESGSVDVVVSTIVFCSVDDPNQCLQEIIRVLKPGGKLVFLEHVKAPHQFYIVRFLQVLLDFSRVWPLMFDGCRVSRNTEESIRKSGFSSVDLVEYQAYELMEYGFLGYFIRSIISGTASK